MYRQAFSPSEGALPLLKKPFGGWLKEMRERKGLSIRGLALKAGISHPSVVNIESGKIGATRDMVRKLADALEVSRSEAVQAWLEDDTQEGGAITYITDPDTAEVVETYEELSDKGRESARRLMEELVKLDRGRAIGGRKADEEEKETEAGGSEISA